LRSLKCAQGAQDLPRRDNTLVHVDASTGSARRPLNIRRTNLASVIAMPTIIRRSTMLAAATLALALAGWGTAAANEAAEPDEAEIAPAPEIAEPADAAEPVLSAEWAGPIDWTVLDWRPAQKPASAFASPRRTMHERGAASSTRWSRTDNGDGSSAVTVKRSLAVEWETDVGADFSLAAPPSSLPGPVNPAALLPGAAADPSAGAAWATLTTPAMESPLGSDRATIDARIDPTQELGRLAVSASKSLTVGRQLALTVQGGYAATDVFAAAPGARIYTTEQAARITFLPTQTAVSAGRTMSTADPHWLHSLNAEQQLFEGASIVGSVSEMPEGPPNTSIVATFKRNW
jgi:hypothetical protein